MTQIIEIDGQKYEIVNWDEFQEKLLDAIGFSIENAIDEQIIQLRCVDKGSGGGLLGSFRHYVKENVLTVYSEVPHAPYIEWGTAGAVVTKVDDFGHELTAKPGRHYPMEYLGSMHGKKQFDLVPELKDWARRHGIPQEGYFGLAKHIWEYGLYPYAPVRRVFYNENLWAEILRNAGRWAAR